MGVFSKFRLFNRRLALACALIAVSTFNYGFDNQAFASTQAMDAFDKQFGVWDEATGAYILEPSWLSLFNSLNYIGFAVVPADARGLMVGSYQLSLAIGGLVINSVCYGTSDIQDNRAWRIPLGLFYIVPSIVLSLIWFIPESPRWLLRKNRVEDAWLNFRKLRDGAFSEEQMEAEFKELRTSLEQEVEQGKFAELFRGINLKRTLIAVGVNFFQQAGGQAFISQYGAVYVKSLGTINPFGFNLITASINIVTMVTILLWADLIGRRKNGIIAMMAMFPFGFAMGWAPLTYVVATEISALRLRDLTSRVGFTVNVIMNFAVNFSIPYLVYDKYAGLGSQVGFIFGSFMVVAGIFVYYCVPECKGKTLEQVDFLFNNGVPLRDFGKSDAAAMMRAAAADGLRKGDDVDVELGSTGNKEADST
ncbi:hypothetical protein G7Z17_g5393 [Cylindrodendrum hubeiense]|uniref:Major facilitator superfamily (MFS) profile domain-containing protein n=1 Tax=Cylindrodendrum hubeiense TaxID=595255 RepID=A0A9P5HBY8_9HYPO|nr:hypothetical protein G7Z17_g5393 [Cylindrodendrum hubeiense]